MSTPRASTVLQSVEGGCSTEARFWVWGRTLGDVRPLFTKALPHSILNINVDDNNNHINTTAVNSFPALVFLTLFETNKNNSIFFNFFLFLIEKSTRRYFRFTGNPLLMPESRGRL